jgi:hypothetical protein
MASGKGPQTMPTQFDESHSIAQHRGKWSQPGVPHRGWTCVGIEDLGEPSMVCEMCESQSIRYVHYMSHPLRGETLGVGRVCAGHMEQDLGRAEQRDRLMVSRSGKRKRWLSRTWRISQKGNEWLQADGYRVTVYPRQGRWGVTIAAVDDSQLRHDWRTYSTSDAAKLAGFDFITRALAARQNRSPEGEPTRPF